MTTKQTFQTENKEEYKQTELVELPKSWEVVKLVVVAEYINSYPFKPTGWKKEGIKQIHNFKERIGIAKNIVSISKIL